MRPTDIRSYLDILKREKELCIIDVPVDPYLELAEIQRRTVEGPALLLTSVVLPSRSQPLIGTRRRKLAFGEDLPGPQSGEAVESDNAIAHNALGHRDLLRTALKLGTKSCSGPVMENVMNPPRSRALPQI
jgi:UbiD family decarboxylase